MDVARVAETGFWRLSPPAPCRVCGPQARSTTTAGGRLGDHHIPHILYCISVWGGAASCNLKRIQNIINFAARVVSGARKHDHISSTVRSLGWDRIGDLVTRRDRLLVFRALNDPLAPEAIRSLFISRSTVSQRVTRAKTYGALELPQFPSLPHAQNFFLPRCEIVELSVVRDRQLTIQRRAGAQTEPQPN